VPKLRGARARLRRVANEDQAVALANDSTYGLSASIWSKVRAQRAARLLEAGGVNVNNAMTHVFQFPLPMAGWKESGLGHRMGGPEGIRKYCRTQAFVCERITLSSEMNWYPYAPRKSRLIGRVLRLVEMRDWRRRLNRRPDRRRR